MRGITLFLTLATCFAFAGEPQVTITTKSTYNGYATVGGRVISATREPVGVSVDNGGIRYSTLADPSGSWAIVFRHASVNFTVRAWTLNRNEEIAATKDQLSE